MKLSNKRSIRLEKFYGKTWQNICLSFAIPFGIMFVALFVMQVTPFGDHSFALTDGKYYINGLLGHARMLRDLFAGKGIPLYGLGGMGSNAWASMSWGEFHPVKLLSLFATIDSAPTWFTWIILINLSLCGVTMYLMLTGLYGHRGSHLLFSTSYALMGFNVVNCFQLLFFIGPQMLPLVVLGLIRLLKGKSPVPYILSLAFCIFCNFYFGLMLCVASAIIFIAYNYVCSDELKGRRAKAFGVYAASSLIAGFLPCFFWLPALKAFSGGGRLDQTKAAEYQFTENMPFIQIFSKLFTGANSANEEVQGLPNIFCGMLVVALVVLFFMNGNISKRIKRAAGAVLGLYLLTFYIKAFTLAMHGFTHTNWFPYRYSFVFSLFMIWIAAEEYRHLDALTVREVRRCGVGIGVAALLIFSVRYEFISGGEVLIDLSLLALMGIAFHLWNTRSDRFTRQVFSAVLMLLVCVNLFGNFVLSIQKLQRTENWELNLNIYHDNTVLSGGLIDGLKNADTSFYRMEKEFSESDSVGADPGLYGYCGVSASGPTIREYTHKQLNKLGVNWFDMRHWYSKGIPAATDALLGLKYLLSDRDLAAEKGYDLRVSIGEASIYQDPYALNYAILADEAIREIELGNDAFDNLNRVWRGLSGGDRDIFTEQQDVAFTLHNAREDTTVTRQELVDSISSAEAGGERETPDIAYIEATFTAAQDGPVYYFDMSVPASAQGRSVPCIECVGVYSKGDTVVHHFTVGDDITQQKMREYASTLLYAYADNDVLAEYAAAVNARDITFNVVRDSNLTGEFDAGAGQRMLFTILWDEGWTCYIDGQKAPIDKTWDMFMSVEVPEGHHTYAMKFFPAWMNYGLMVSGAALLGFMALMIAWHIRKKKSAAALPRPEETEAFA